MRVSYKGLILAGLQLALVMSVGAKLLIDRARLPRVWVRSAPYDPSMPIRGRYVSLRLEAQLPADFKWGTERSSQTRAKLRVEDNRLVAVPVGYGDASGIWFAPAGPSQTADAQIAIIQEPVAFFIPEHIPDPSWRKANEELWVEVTVPKKGLPRPIRLGVKSDGTLTPLSLN